MADCSCIAVYVDDGPEFSNVVDRRARKEHRCGECGLTIGIGEIFEHAANGYDGTVTTHKTCKDCESVRSAFFCEGYYYGRIWDDVHGHIPELVWSGEIPKGDCMASLTKAARDKICDMIEEEWEHADD